jgi:beta-glucosidase
MRNFPKDFKWGVATSSYQIEGGNNNADWALWEEKKGLDKAGNACGSYEKYIEDIELLKKINVNSYRFSLEWSRIEPNEGDWNIEAIEHYKDMIKRLKIENIEPFVTLFHFTLPQWVSREKGFENKKIIEYFKRYVGFVVENLGSDVNFWITINEPEIYSTLGYITGEWPPGRRNSYIKYFKVIRNLEIAHIQSYKRINELYKKYGWSKPSISISKNNTDIVGKDFISKLYVWFLKYIFSYSYLNRVRNYIDFIGLNIYFYSEIVFDPFSKGNFLFRTLSLHNFDKQDIINWDINPKSMYNIVMDIHNRYKKDIYITENGLSDIKDTRKSKYIKDNLEYLLKAIDKGAHVKGYFHWSMIDNFEWIEGFKPKFGIAFINNNGERVLKKSGKYYSNIIKNNSL